MPSTSKNNRPAAHGQTSGLKVLIVENDADCATSMATLLRPHGYDVKICKSGQPAKDAARADEPDVILVHAGPLSANGFELAKQISTRRITNTGLLIAVVGLGQATDERLAAQDGFDLNLVMPVDPEHIVEALRGFQGLIESQALPGNQQWQDWTDHDSPSAAGTNRLDQMTIWN